jgi:hypothetical protein
MRGGADARRKDLDALLSRINALEIAARDEYQRGTIKVMRTLVEGQIHSIDEFEHLKKAMDLLLLQIFELQKKANA